MTAYRFKFPLNCSRCLASLVFSLFVVQQSATPAQTGAREQELLAKAFGDVTAFGHWECLVASWNDFDGDYGPMTFSEGTQETPPRWVVRPGWHILIAADGHMHADNGNDAVLRLWIERSVSLRYEIEVANKGEAAVFFSVTSKGRKAQGRWVGSKSNQVFRGVVDLQPGDFLDLRVALKDRWHCCPRQLRVG